MSPPPKAAMFSCAAPSCLNAFQLDHVSTVPENALTLQAIDPPAHLTGTDTARLPFVRDPGERCHQSFERGRETGIGRGCGGRRCQLGKAMACRGVAMRVGDELWALAAATLDRTGATGVKAASGRRIEHARRIALQNHAVAFCACARHRDRGKERAAVGMAW